MSTCDFEIGQSFFTHSLNNRHHPGLNFFSALEHFGFTAYNFNICVRVTVTTVINLVSRCERRKML